MKKNLLLLFLVFAFLSACAPNPVDVAQADVMRTEAAQKAKDAEAARAQQQKTYDLEHEKQQAITAQWVASAKFYIYYAMIFATIATCLALLGLGIGTGWGAAGVGRAVAILAETKARLVYMDQNTMHFPLIEYAGKGYFALTDPNTGDSRRLDRRITANPQMIAESFGVRKIGILAQKAQRSNDPTGMAMIGLQPVIADVYQSPELLQVGNLTQQLIGVGGEHEQIS